jgi:hypothetical protein
VVPEDKQRTSHGLPPALRQRPRPASGAESWLKPCDEIQDGVSLALQIPVPPLAFSEQ